MRLSEWFSWDPGRFAIFMVIALLLQPIRGVSDHGLDLVMLVVVLGGLRMPVAQAALWGLASGFVQDLGSIAWMGPHLIGNCLVASAASWFKNRIYRERVYTQALLVLGSVILKQIVLVALFAWDDTLPGGWDGFFLGGRAVLATTTIGWIVSFLLVRYGRRYRDPATA